MMSHMWAELTHVSLVRPWAMDAQMHPFGREEDAFDHSPADPKGAGMWFVDQIGEENADKLTVVKVNVDEEPGLAQQYGITGIPALQVFQGGQLVKQMVGAKPKPALLADLADFIK